MKQIMAPVLALGLTLGGCALKDAPPVERVEAESVGVERFVGNGFSLRYPAGARLVEPAESPTEQIVRIAGPDIALRPADADWVQGGAGYMLDVITYENPERLTAQAWVEQHILSVETLSPPKVADAVVAGEPAIRVAAFGGDSEIVTYYLARGERVVGLRYSDIPVANSPIAQLQRDIYALVLGSFRWEGGAAR
jgi:hypothetical protein